MIRQGKGADTALCLLIDDLGGQIAPLPGDDLIAFAVLAHQERLQDALGGNAAGEFGHFILAACLADIDRGDLEVSQGDVLNMILWLMSRMVEVAVRRVSGNTVTEKRLSWMLEMLSVMRPGEWAGTWTGKVERFFWTQVRSVAQLYVTAVCIPPFARHNQTPLKKTYGVLVG